VDWAKAIEINREALTRIVAALVSMLAAQGGVLRLSLPVYQAISRVLYPAESAVRRLIVIAAQGLVLPVSLARPMPQGLKIERNGSRVAFQLFDTRKHFTDVDESGAQSITGPRIRVVGDPDPRSLFLAQFAKPADDSSNEAGTLRLQNRLTALKQALDHLPRQAKRLMRWRARRAKMTVPKFTSPLRPGPPPGHRKRSRDEIDLVLVECHALAWDALSHDTS
jgi:hypothetical protein